MGIYQLVWLFFGYSFLGWVLEISYVALRQHRYSDRGVVNGPLCIVYGVAGAIITVGTRDLAESWFWTFVGSAVVATVVEWTAGHLLERCSQVRWWDYTNNRFNLDGYICLSASVLWGILGVAVVKWLNPLLLWVYGLVPAGLGAVLVWVLSALLAVDLLGTGLAIAGIHTRMPQVEAVNSRLAALTIRMGNALLGRIERRLQRTAKEAVFRREKRQKPTVFAEGCNFYKIALLFFIGAFLGDLTEMVFCRITAGYWMSRSSVVWGSFSIVWGLAIALVTKLLYPYKDRPASFMFVAGTVLGGVYEYLCSVFTEIVFGTVFWDYSAIPFNLGGRINLLYCFFWGFAAVAWFKVLYPPIARLIERLPMRGGKLLTWGLVVFMAVDIAVSSAALVRYNERVLGIPAETKTQAYLDKNFDDARMYQVYPKAVHTGA